MEIKCKYDKIMSVSDLEPLKHPRNYNEHGKEQLDNYHEVIKSQGIRKAVRISNFSGFMTVGHGLLKTALVYGIESLPVEYQAYDNEEQELADILADNNLARMATVNRVKRDSIIHELVEKGVDVKITGLPKDILDDILGNIKKIDLTVPDFSIRDDYPGSDYDDTEEDEDDNVRPAGMNMPGFSPAKQKEIENSRKRPIAVILDRSYYAKWEALKQSKFKVSGDTTAVMKIIDYFEEREEDKK